MKKNILISGGGIAGCTLAYFLYKQGFSLVVIESTAEFKRRGYLLALNEQIGKKVTQKMGLLNKLKEFEVSLTNNEMYDWKANFLLRFTLDHKTQNERVGLMLNRADLHLVLYNAVKNDVEFRMGQESSAIDQDEKGIQISFTDGKKEMFDLVVGADGIHSKMRESIFGQGFEKYMGYAYFAFVTSNPAVTEQLGKNVVKMIRGDGFTIAYHRLKNDEIGAYLFHKEKVPKQMTVENRREYMVQKYGQLDENFRAILEGMKADDYVFRDTFTQIVMPGWHKERVCLIGDAAFCPTPASGVGASMAMAAGYILAKNLSETEDHDKAFSAYDNYMRPYVKKAQTSASRMLLLAAGGSIISYEFTNFLLRLIPGGLVGRLHSHAIDMPLP